MTEHLVLVASLFICLCFSVYLDCASRNKPPHWSRQDHYSGDVAIWSVKHPSVELSVDQTFEPGRKKCFRVTEKTSHIPFALSRWHLQCRQLHSQKSQLPISASPGPRQTGFGELWFDRGPWLLTNQLVPTVKVFLHSDFSFPLLFYLHGFLKFLSWLTKVGQWQQRWSKGRSHLHTTSKSLSQHACLLDKTSESTKKNPQMLPVVCSCIADKVMRTYASTLYDRAFSSAAQEVHEE